MCLAIPPNPPTNPPTNPSIGAIGQFSVRGDNQPATPSVPVHAQAVDASIMSVRVVARIRPLLEKEVDKDVIVTTNSTDDGKTPNIVKIPSPKNEAEEFSFTFNSVYDQPTSQEQLFTSEGIMACPSLNLVCHPIQSLNPPPDSCSPLEGTLPRPRSHDIRVRSHGHGQNTYNARRSQAGRTRRHPQTSQRCLP